MRTVILAIFVMQSLFCSAQTFIKSRTDNDAKTEYRNGKNVAFLQHDGFTMGMINTATDDGYGTYYQIELMIVNETDHDVTFQPEQINACIYKKAGYMKPLKIYSSKRYQKKLAHQHGWASFFIDLLSDEEVSNYYARNKIFRAERKMLEVGYLNTHTLHPGETLTGYINVKYKKGEIMTVNVPIDNTKFSFDWDTSGK